MQAILVPQRSAALLLEGDEWCGFVTAERVEQRQGSVDGAASWLRGAEDAIFLEDVTAEQVQKELRWHVAFDRAFRFFLALFDRDLTSSLRSEVAREIESALSEDRAVADALGARFYASPFPRPESLFEAIDLSRNADTIYLSRFLKGLQDRQALIAQVTVAWDGIPELLVLECGPREKVRKDFVEQGIFFRLVETLAKKASMSVFVEEEDARWQIARPRNLRALLNEFVLPFSSGVTGKPPATPSGGTRETGEVVIRSAGQEPSIYEMVRSRAQEIARINGRVDFSESDWLEAKQEAHGGRPATDPRQDGQDGRPMVFSGIYPINTADFQHLKAAMGKLQLSDSSFVFQAESSVALGFGFRCGFLGLLHMESIQERLRREYNMDIIATYPSVIYEVVKTNGEVLRVDNPEFLPDVSVIQEIREPIVKCFIMVPNEYTSGIMQLILDRRGVLDHSQTMDSRWVMLICILPLDEIVVDFIDKMKAITRGYGIMDYEHAGMRAEKLVKLDILVNGEPVDAFSSIVHRDKAEARGRQLAAKLKEVIPTQLYQVAIQAAIGGKIIARESVSAMRKDVTAKCYGGDISRKRTLLEKMKEGKKRMKSIGRVGIPQETFIEVLKKNSGDDFGNNPPKT